MEKNNFGNNKPNQQVYYTQEGTPYYLRRASRVVDLFSAPVGGLGLILVGLVNDTNAISNWTSAAPHSNILITTAKPVVPVMFSYMAIDLSPGPTNLTTIACLQLPFYCFWEGIDINAGASFKALNPLSKMAPLVEMIEASTSTNTLVYGCKYNQVTLADEDFIETQGSAAFIFNESQANSYTGIFQSFKIPESTSIRAVMTFLYFELQK